MRKKTGLSVEDRAIVLNDLAQTIDGVKTILKTSQNSTRTSQAHNVALRAAVGKLERAHSLIAAEG